jgi:hypothetical protein
MLLNFCPYDFEMVPVAPIITGITFAFIFHIIIIIIINSCFNTSVIPPHEFNNEGVDTCAYHLLLMLLLLQLYLPL